MSSNLSEENNINETAVNTTEETTVDDVFADDSYGDVFPVEDAPKADSQNKSNDKKKRKNKKMVDQNQVYSNMKARAIVLFVGLGLTTVAFVFAALSVFMLFFNMEGMVPENQTTASLTKIFSSVALSTSFVGVILSVAGANTHKGLARLSFFFAIVGFFAGLVMWLFSSLGVFLFG